MITNNAEKMEVFVCLNENAGLWRDLRAFAPLATAEIADVFVRLIAGPVLYMMSACWFVLSRGYSTKLKAASMD
jgi:hypothetical protein